MTDSARSLHILFAVHGYKPAYRVGGPIHSVSALAETLVRRGHRVTVFTTNSNLDEDLDVPVDVPLDVDGVTVWYFRREDPMRRYFGWLPYLSQSMGLLYAPAMAAALERIMPTVDVVHTHMPFVYPTFAAARAAARHGTPLVYHQRGVFDPARLRFRGVKKRAFIRIIERPTMRRASTLIALTEAEVASYRALGVGGPIEVIPNGIDVTQYRESPLRAIGDRYGISTSATVVLFLGRIHPTKGADRLLEAFIRIQARHPSAHLVIAGPDEWGLEQQFLGRVMDAGVANKVHFPGMLLGDEKRDWLARANLFALPSDAEGFSMAVLEAMASTTAVLLSPGCHFPQVASEGAGVIGERDASSLATDLDRILGDRATLSAMGQKGRALVERDYTWDKVTDDMVSVYVRASAARTARRR